MWKWSISSFDNRFSVPKYSIHWQTICPIDWHCPVLSPQQTKKIPNAFTRSISICMINNTIWEFLSMPPALTSRISWHSPRPLKRCIAHLPITSVSPCRSTAKWSGRMIGRRGDERLRLFSSWYERAREKAWKKFGGRFFLPHTKRVYPKEGLLGYKVLVDGYNHVFEAPPTQARATRSGSSTRPNQEFAYGAFSEDERAQNIRIKSSMKQYVMDERQRAKQIAAATLKQLRRPPKLLPRPSPTVQKSSAPMKVQSIRSHHETSPSSDPFQSLNQSSINALAASSSKTKLDLDTGSATGLSNVASTTATAISSSKGPFSLARSHESSLV